VILDLFTIN